MPKSLSNKSPAAAADVIDINADLLSRWPLPVSDEDSENEERGRVLAIGGAVSMPGAIILSSTAVLRSGAGKLQIATCRSIASAVAVAVPEALMVGLPETEAGGIDPAAAKQLAPKINTMDVVLAGPGMVDPQLSSISSSVCSIRQIKSLWC